MRRGRARWPRWPWLFISLLLIGSVAAWQWAAWRGNSKRPLSNIVDHSQQQRTRPADYIGSVACHECHSSLYDSYSRHPMANSTSPAFAAEPVEDFVHSPSFSPVGPTRYAVERQGERVLHHELRVDKENQVVYDQAVPVHFAIGSGKRGRSYLINREGLLFQSPISWYTQRGVWDLSPGYEPERHVRFERRATDRCLQCHVGRLNYAAPPEGADVARYRDPPFQELGISCERCHGPGKDHIAWHRQNTKRTGSDPIVNPKRLDPWRRDAVCNQCHLQGDFQILRHGRSHDDFRPGDYVGDVWTVFLGGTGVERSGETSAVSQVQQMMVSRCYVETKGQLGCITCHDPHQVPPEELRSQHYNQRCKSCHQPDSCAAPLPAQQQPPAVGSCIACHMPRLTAHDVPHTSQTDHRILRSPPSKAEPAAAEQDRKLVIFDGDPCQLSDEETALAFGLMLVERTKTEGDTGTAKEAEKHLLEVRDIFADDARVWDGLAICASRNGRADLARHYWLEALQRRPHDEDILYSLALDAIGRGEVAGAVKFADRLLEQNPWNAEMHWHRSKLLFRRGQLDQALRDATRAVELNPGMPAAQEWLARVYRSMGKDDLAAACEEVLRRLHEPVIEPLRAGQHR